MIYQTGDRPVRPIAIVGLSRHAAILARSLCNAMGHDADAFATARFANAAPNLGIVRGSVADWAGLQWERRKALVFVGPTPLAIRAIAPYISPRGPSPAVVLLDEQGAFAVPLIPGSLDAADNLARNIATVLGGRAALTTPEREPEPVDVQGWAELHGCTVEDPQGVASEVREALSPSSPPRASAPDDGTSDATMAPEVSTMDRHATRAQAPAPRVGLAVSDLTAPAPFEATLWLRPRTLSVGMSLRRGVAVDDLVSYLDELLECESLARGAVGAIASIDSRAAQPVLAALSERIGVPLRVFSASELAGLEGDLSQATFSEQVGVTENVCERAALLAAVHRQGADGTHEAVHRFEPELIIPTTAFDGTSFAVVRGSVRGFSVEPLETTSHVDATHAPYPSAKAPGRVPAHL